jgi:hypothetical protein
MITLTPVLFFCNKKAPIEHIDAFSSTNFY